MVPSLAEGPSSQIIRWYENRLAGHGGVVWRIPQGNPGDPIMNLAGSAPTTLQVGTLSSGPYGGNYPTIINTSSVGGTFDFLSATFSCACSTNYPYQPFGVVARGYRNGELVVQEEFQPTFYPTQVLPHEFNWLNLERVELAYWSYSFGNHAVDDIEYQLNAVPVPAAVWLFGSALGVMGWMRRTIVA